MDGDTADVAVDEFDLSAVKSSPELDTECGNGTDNGDRSLNGVSRTLERGDEAIARGLDLAAAKPCQYATHGLIVLAEQREPPVVSPSGHLPGGVDDVRKQNGGEYPVVVAGQDLLAVDFGGLARVANQPDQT